MKMWWLCDSENYPLKGIPYLGKVGNTRASGLASTVELLVDLYKNTNRNITCDNYFTDFDLSQK